MEIEEPSLFTVAVTWESFRNVIKEKLYPVGGCDDLYTKMDHTVGGKRPSSA
jgi:hypothetical protein